LEIFPSYEDRITKVEFFGDEVERISIVNHVTGEVEELLQTVRIYPAKHYVAEEREIESAIVQIELELEERINELMSQGKLVEAQRLKQRTRFDIEMLKEVGYCNGIENYSRVLEGREPGSPPQTLIDYFVRKYGRDGFITFIDESHVTIPQLRGMYHGDRSRKDTLIDYGFRLPCARDNRPLTSDEFFDRVGKVIFVSATPGDWENQVATQVVEQVIRPTGLVDPVIDIRPIKGQIDDLIGEIKMRSARKERVLVTTLTKRMAEDLTEYLTEIGIKVKWLHSEVKALDRVELLRDLRLGIFDVLVGVNLLREGLDLPEVSLVAIMEADKEGFLRAERSLIQTIGRAARNADGRVIMYADKITDSMDRAIKETERRRAIQLAHNEEHGITPTTIIKDTGNVLLESLRGKDDKTDELKWTSKGKKGGKKGSRGQSQDQDEELQAPPAELFELSEKDLANVVRRVEKEMKDAARELDFETAAHLRDQLKQLLERQQHLRKGK